MSFFKSKAKTNQVKVLATSNAKKSKANGKSKNAIINPYLNAKITYRDNLIALANNRLWLMILLIVAVLIALGCTASAISSANRSVYVPYVVAVDNHGVSVPAGIAREVPKANDKLISSTLAQFIVAVRSVTVDVSYLTRNLDWAYAHVKDQTPAKKSLEAWLSGATGVKNPVERASTEIVSCDIVSVLKQTENTYTIEWIETIRSRSIEKAKKEKHMKALMTVEMGDPPNANDTKGIIFNPLGIYIKEFNWD